MDFFIGGFTTRREVIQHGSTASVAPPQITAKSVKSAFLKAKELIDYG
ncbi:MAG: hypothetical protein AAF224_14670 [Pseudomonadota bacterium]